MDLFVYNCVCIYTFIYIYIYIYVQLSSISLDFKYIYIYLNINTFRFDAFSGTDAHTIGELALREKFATECNVRFMCREPGGWAEWGQPCDDVHEDFSWDLIYIYILFVACKKQICVYIYIYLNV